ncbi:hypothetical protein Gotur_020232 [Gossypium turneri]
MPPKVAKSLETTNSPSTFFFKPGPPLSLALSLLDIISKGLQWTLSIYPFFIYIFLVQHKLMENLSLIDSGEDVLYWNFRLYDKSLTTV